MKLAGIVIGALVFAGCAVAAPSALPMWDSVLYKYVACIKHPDGSRTCLLPDGTTERNPPAENTWILLILPPDGGTP